MNLTADHIPRQKVPESKKTDEWHQQNADAFINLSRFGGSFSDRDRDLKKLYEYYNGEVDESDYSHVLKPYGKKRKNFPAKMQNYNILKPVIDRLIGEKAGRPLDYRVTIANPDAVTRKKQAKHKFILKRAKAEFVQALAEAGIKTGEAPGPNEKKKQPKFEELTNLFDESYSDSRAITGQNALNYITYNEEIKDKFNKGWKDFLITGEVYSFRGVVSDEVTYKIINPIDVDYDKDPDLEFVEDGDWAVWRQWMHPSTVIDNYYDVLTPGEVDRLENPRQDHLDSGFLYNRAYSEPDPHYKNRKVQVCRVYWKSRKKIGFLRYFDPDGVLQERIVPEGYKPDKDAGESVEWHWVNEVRETHRIDGDIYKRQQPLENQRGSLDNPSKCKLPINGRAYSDRNADNISLVSIGIPYQLSYNIYKYRLENAIAKSKDVIAQLDINMIPTDWSMDKFMYFVDATGIAWVDYNKEGVKIPSQHKAIMDMSLKTIESYVSLLQSIQAEWEDISGVSRQRRGNVGEYEGKGTTQQAIAQSALMTEDYFRKFARLEQRDLQALVDYSKDAWIDGKKSTYVMPDMSVEFLEIEGTDHAESNYGVFVTGASKETRKVQMLQELSQSMVQNGTSASVIAEIIDSDSFATIKQKIEDAEKKQRKFQQKMKKMELQKENAGLKETKLKEKHADKRAALDRQTDIELARIKDDDSQEQRKLDLEAAEQEDERRLEEKKLEEEKRHNKAQEEIDRMEARNKADSDGDTTE